MQLSYYMAILVTVLLADGSKSTGYISHSHEFQYMGACQRIISNRDNLPQIYESLKNHIGDQLVEAREIGCFTEDSLRETNESLDFTYSPFQGV